jgi:hypothetical protein
MAIWHSFIADKAMPVHDHLLLNKRWQFGYVLLLNICWQFGDTQFLRFVGTLLDGYLKLNPPPQVPTKQSAPTSKICLPPYLGLPIVIPMLCRIVGPAIAKAQFPW